MPPSKFCIDYTTPYEVVDLVDGCAPLTGSSNVVSNGGPPKSSDRPRTTNPQAIYSVLDVPISTSQAVRIGCWSTSPIDLDLDALKGIIYPNFLELLSDPSDPCKAGLSTKIPEAASSPSVRVDEHTYSEVKTAYSYGGSEVITVVKDSDAYHPSPAMKSILESRKYEVPDSTDRTSIVDDLKEDLKYYEISFKSQYCYGTTGTLEDRYLIKTLSPDKTFAWKEKSSGILWSGVYGMDEICVVTLRGDLDWKRVRGCFASSCPDSVLYTFRRCVLSELEDLADPSSMCCEKLGRSFDTPFFVVSATPATAKTLEESGHEASSVGYPEEAIRCVRGSSLLRQYQDSSDAIKLAIFGFLCLVGKKCEAKDIEVTVLFGRNFGSGYTRDLDISEIGNYLAVVESH